MRENFTTASGIPFSNEELLKSNAYRGTGRLYPTATVICETKGLFPAIYRIQVEDDGQVVARDADLLREINATRSARLQERRLEAGLPEKPDETEPKEKAFIFKPTLSRQEHYTTYTEHRQKTKHSPHGLPFTIGVGGFIFVDNEKEAAKRTGGKTNDPHQFVMKRAGQINPGVWSNPSGLASGSFFTDMARHIVRETGIVLLNERNKVATVVAPEIYVMGGEYAFLSKDFKAVDSVAIKNEQLPKIRAALEREGFGDYRIEVRSFGAELLTDRLPPRDKLTLKVPHQSGRFEREMRAFVVKDECGSVNINLPFRMRLAEDQKILCIDCEGLGREAALKTQDQLQVLDIEAKAEGRKALTKDLADWVGRPNKTSYIPDPAPKREILSGVATFTRNGYMPA